LATERPHVRSGPLEHGPAWRVEGPPLSRTIRARCSSVVLLFMPRTRRPSLGTPVDPNRTHGRLTFRSGAAVRTPAGEVV
jgi:hypothetical protein